MPSQGTDILLAHHCVATWPESRISAIKANVSKATGGLLDLFNTKQNQSVPVSRHVVMFHYMAVTSWWLPVCAKQCLLSVYTSGQNPLKLAAGISKPRIITSCEA